jgi:hypothetical protein
MEFTLKDALKKASQMYAHTLAPIPRSGMKVVIPLSRISSPMRRPFRLPPGLMRVTITRLLDRWRRLGSHLPSVGSRMRRYDHACETALPRASRGVLPVQLLKAWENPPTSRYPSIQAICEIERAGSDK